MPQGRRKVPFSGKAKKAQIMMKRERKEESTARSDIDDQRQKEDASTSAATASDKGVILMDVPLQGKSTKHRYELMFKEESKSDIAANREKARQPFKILTDQKDFEIDVETFYPKSLDFPTRPFWDQSMSKSELEASESRYFRSYVTKIMEAHQNNLSFFELNLETWRQLWRVIEMSDILLVIVDIRCPAFPPSLYNYVNDHPAEKNIVLILNKVDLVPAALALAWKEHFEKSFPNLKVAFFSSCPSYNLRTGLTSKPGLKFRKLRGRISMVAEGAKSIFDECSNIAKNSKNLKDVDLDSWKQKIDKALGGVDSSNEADLDGSSIDQKILTIGTVGHPNVGKSSLINSLMGKRVVSVSKTPGHTKHFQTIFISKSVKLCDCPGLVFPSLMPKPLQVLQGSYPISQVREGLSVVQYLAERVDLINLLSITHPENEKAKWSAFDVCEAWAIKRGYTTARTNRPDVFRAANHIMRMTLEGKITLSFFPPNFDQNLWENHPNLVQIKELLGLTDQNGDEEDDGEDLEEMSEDDEVADDVAKEEKQPEPAPSKNKFDLLLEMDE